MLPRIYTYSEDRVYQHFNDFPPHLVKLRLKSILRFILGLMRTFCDIHTECLSYVSVFCKLEKPYNLFLTDQVLVFISIFLLKNHTIYFGHVFLSPNSSRFLPIPHPPNFMLFLCLKPANKKTKTNKKYSSDTCKHTCQNQNKQAKDQQGKKIKQNSKQNETKMSTKIPLCSFCVGHLLLGVGPALKADPDTP